MYIHVGIRAHLRPFSPCHVDIPQLRKEMDVEATL